MAKKWYSILVSTAIFENGAKNPSKGISMKFLVEAFDAQLRVFSGSKKDGATCNGMQALTLPLWRLVINTIQ